MDDRTPGRWCQFHGEYCEEAKDTDYRLWDTSHDVSAILPDGTRYKVAHFRHARDAAYVEKLVNNAEADAARLRDLEALVEEARAKTAFYFAALDHFEDAMCEDTLDRVHEARRELDALLARMGGEHDRS